MISHVRWVENLVNQQISAYHIQTNQTETHISPELKAQITDTVLQNLSSNRAQRVISGYRGGSSLPAFSLTEGFDNTVEPHCFQEDLAGYITQVIQTYLTEYPTVTLLYQPHQPTWDELHLKLSHWARGKVRKNYLPAHLVTDVVQDVCLKIHQRIYPYDITFDAWAGGVLNNQVRHYTRQKDVLAQDKLISLDEALDADNFPHHERIRDEQATHYFAQVDNQNQISYALAELKNEARLEVILLYYFEGLSYPEIAAKLNKSESAIRTLKHRALKDLADYL